MNRSRFSLRPLILTLVLALPAGLVGQVPIPPDRIEAAAAEGRALVDSLVLARDLPGMQVAVSVEGHIVWSEGFGHADVETRTPITPLSRFRVGSVSKSLTAAALARLVEDGALDLDAPVQTYVPDFPEKRWPITTRQLAGHLSGIRHYRGDEMLSDARYETVSEGLEIFRDDPLLFEPGARYSYSSYAWNLLSAVIEGASGEPFLRHVRTRVFEPLGLRHTVPDWTDSLIAYRTSYYVQGSDGRLLNAPYVDNSYKWAGGGFLSTAEDLVTFADAHARPGFLRAETLELLFTSQQTNDGEETNYGIGWRTVRDDLGRRLVGHGGGSVGGSTMLILYPEERVAVATIVNMSGAPGGEALARRLAAPFLEALDASAGEGR
ncbi:MAG: serine hydrolase domain-containing protein [Gemmatimonadota bacterium]|nr:serine hydrolase domain-containing protein [Gemmatimonadota bacterium]